MRSRFQMAIAVVTVLAVSTTAVGFETPPGVEPQNGSVQVPGDNIATIPGGVAGVLQTIGSALSGILGPLGGIFRFVGGEVPVHDRRNELHLIAQLTEMTAQTVQLISIAKSVKDHLEHARYQAKMITNPARYKALATPWRLASALDSFAQLTGIAGNNRIIQALNTGIGAYDVWRNRGVLLGTYARTPPFLGTQIAYGRLELSDGLAGGAVDVVGRIRANAAATETAITELETDSFSLLPDDNTEIAVLNKINGAGMLSVRGQQDTNKLLASVTELGLAQEARIRDETARAINNDIAFTEGAQDALERQRQGFAAAARNWSF